MHEKKFHSRANTIHIPIPDPKPGSSGASAAGHNGSNEYRPDPTRADRIRNGSEKESSGGRHHGGSGRNGSASNNLSSSSMHNGSRLGNGHKASPAHLSGANGGGQPSKATRKGQLVIALYNYQGSELGDMTFEKGDVMEIVDDTDPDWWLAKNVKTGSQGHIPRNYVAFQSSIESQEWFFGDITRREAEDILAAHTNFKGTFLIRNSEQNPGGFALSIKDWDPERNFHVKHYKAS